MVDFVVLGKALGGLALLAMAGGGAYTSVSRKLPVEPDHCVEHVLAALPGANCGACGRLSCFATAVAMCEGRLPVDACVFGGRRVAESVGLVLDEKRCARGPLASLRLIGERWTHL